MKQWMKFNYAQACLDWFRYMQKQCHAEPLLGDVMYAPLIQMLADYETQSCHQEYGAEIPLIGEAGIDISVQYNCDGFMNGNSIVNKRLKHVGELFHKYVNVMMDTTPDAVPYNCLYLEADTKSGLTEKVAYFYPLENSVVDRFLPVALELSGQADRQQIIMDCLKKAKGFDLRHLGIMKSRQADYTRLAMVFTGTDMEEYIAVAESFAGIDFALAAGEILSEIGKLGIFDITFNIDIMPDGSIGDTFGAELLMKETYPTKRRKLMNSSEYAKFISMLKQLEMADDRVDIIDRCVFSEETRTLAGYEYIMDSRISHFKLRWKNNTPMPAKVYLQLNTIAKMHTINESI